MMVKRWRAFCREELQLGDGCEEFVNRWWNDVIHVHMKPSIRRSYHNLTHLAELFEKAATFPLSDMTSVGLAIFFHDVIYEPAVKDGKTNEEKSAMIFHEFASEAKTLCNAQWCSDERIEDVYSWIIETSRHTTTTYVSPFSQSDFLIFLDMDMSILGASHDRYQEYSKAVRQEYIHINDADFCQGRATFLKSLLNCRPEQLFKTAEAQKRYYQQAICNIQGEIAMLEKNRL